MTENSLEHLAVMVEPVLKEEGTPALVNVAEGHAREEHVVQGGSAK